MAPSKLSLKKIQYEDGGIVRKLGAAFQILREAEAMAFVQKHTSIPVPKIFDVQVRGIDSWILMERVSGIGLDSAWPTLTENAKATIATELKAYLSQLRSIQPPGSVPGFIGSCTGGPAYDHRLNNGLPCGPFASEGEFHDFLVAPVREEPRPELAARYRSCLPDDHGINFAHADLSFDHILVDPDGNGKVMAIIDWEMAGFWPSWWEYRKALYGSRTLLRWWPDLVHRVMPSWRKEWLTDFDLEYL
jgi:aminoglycoside phosphotransferase (APT) family kinase protein